MKNADKPASETLQAELDELRREVLYLRRNAEETVARMLLADTQAMAIRHELEQRRRGFSLMAELAITLGQDGDYESVFVSVSRRVNAALNMQRTAVLIPDAGGGFRASVLQGYSAEEKNTIMARRIGIDAELLDPHNPVLITGEDPDTRLAALREALALPYLISSPVLLHNDVIALLVTGRLTEQRPFLPRLGRSDVDTVQTVSAYLAAMLAGYRLRRAETLANYDPLTQLPNLRRTTERLRDILALARHGGYFSAVLFIDLDGFKVVNDTYGHAAGDVVLRIVAERLTRCVRESDLVGRIGGDEFVVVLSRINRLEDAGVVAGKIIEKLSEPVEMDGTSCRIGASVGIAIFPDHGGDESSLLDAADGAMYAVKHKGKNAFCYAIRR